MKKTIFVLCMLQGVLSLNAATQISLVEKQTDWLYFKGIREPSAQVGQWRDLDFDDSSWLTGGAPLYYGTNIPEHLGQNSTLLSDMRGNYSTVYLRKKVQLPSGHYENLKMNMFIDDGFILWINGTEVQRFNIGDGEQPYTGLSPDAVPTAYWQEYDLSQYSSLLKPGAENIIALQTFNITLGNSGDFSFDMQMSADQTEDLVAPTVLQLNPVSGVTVGNPLTVTVTFSEPVKGVQKDSLRGNSVQTGAPVDVVDMKEISPEQYAFTFANCVQLDTVAVSWNPNTVIKDCSERENAFVVPSQTYSYTVDPNKKEDSKVIINEIMAANASGLTTRTGACADWIELYNRSDENINLAGWYLTDSDGNLTKWQFPANTRIAAKGYLIVFCDSSSTSLSGSREYHANFSLSRSGEYLALVEPDGETVAYEFSPGYPQQYVDISYSADGYYQEPTPGAANSTPYKDVAAEVTFSEPRGYKSASFRLALSTETEGATIYYTSDGTVPTSRSTKYRSPVKIDRISCIRAIAVKDGYISSPVATRTWLFIDEALKQSHYSTPSGWPSSYSVNSHRMVYGMNSTVVNDPKYSKQMYEGMTNICTLSLVTDLKNLFDRSTGIYVNPNQDGERWERPMSLELIDPNGGEEFQIEAGMRIRGGFSRSSDNPKHSFRFFFKDIYGGKLHFPLFGDEGADEFSKVDLRTSQNYAWSYLAGNPPEYNTFIRETFTRDAQRDVGMPYTRSRYYHLYINGQYWGLYQTQERSESDFAATYMGGESEDWDCIKTGPTASDGNLTAFQTLYNIAIRQGFTGEYYDNYNKLKGLNPDGTRNPSYPILLDEDNLIQFVLNYMYTCDLDSPIGLGGASPNNLYGLYNRVNPSGFSWYRHDAEHSMGAKREASAGYDMTTRGMGQTSIGNFTPIQLHQQLIKHPDYRMRFIDLTEQTYVDTQGPMSTKNSIARWNSRQQELDKAIYLESARWTWDCNMRYENWIAECDWVKNSFLSYRGDNMISHLRNRGWYPSMTKPVVSKTPALIEEGTTVQIVGDGIVYYTLDGTDPRLPGGDLNPNVKTIETAYSEEMLLLPKESDWLYYDLGDTPKRTDGKYWYQTGYDRSSWKQGKARFGFGPKSVNTPIASTRVTEEKPLTTAYFSTTFEVANKMLVPGLLVNINCDDGAVVYINGSRVINHNMPNEYLTADLFAASEVAGDTENVFTTYELAAKYVVDGENVISVEIHQSSLEDDDLYFDMEVKSIAGTVGSMSGGVIKVSPGDILNVRSRRADGEWSPIAKADYTVYSEYSDLKVTELMYSATKMEGADWSRDDYAWIELQNTGKGILDLQGIKFTSGIDYVFPACSLKSGEYVVLCKNLEAFSLKYDTNGICLFTGYSGNFARKGEVVTIQAPTGENIISFEYSNTWYPDTDRGGHSLVVADVDAEEELWSTPDNWFVSNVLEGTPGYEDTVEVIPPSIESMLPEEEILKLRTGSLLKLSVEALGASPLRIQWYKDDVAIPNATAATFTIASLTEEDSGVYTVSVKNRFGAVDGPHAVNVQVYMPVYYVIADNYTRYKGEANPPLTYHVLDALGEDVTETIGGQAKLSTTALKGSPIGEYPIVVLKGTLPDGNTYEYQNGILTVVPRMLRVVADNQTRPYGQANPLLTYRIFDAEGNDITATIEGAPRMGTTALKGSHPGEYPITVLQGTLKVPDGWLPEFSNGTLTITKAESVIVWNAPAPITAGTPLSGDQLNATCSLPGNFVYTPAMGEILPEGTHTLSVEFTPQNTVDYQAATASVELLVKESEKPSLSYILVDGRLIFTFTGKLQVSTDLVNWEYVDSDSGTYEINLQDTGSSGQRFYRASN